ncbi:hypothetical protein NC653_018017 [Populus alba x Populus x berolinensis]|uniref:Uncharacterized protein n=1 Tax=Populus alba x Populus x berolinensis TaxID=444605 RepID=A0AAD6W1Z0_9ROSI|nr:hypothetical protein NC653_018017 [Populus alba x Populus x berolinensis]
MSTEEPPPFQEAARCDVCKCSFNTFRRRALPQFGILSNVRVCADCFNDSTRLFFMPLIPWACFSAHILVLDCYVNILSTVAVPLSPSRIAKSNVLAILRIDQRKLNPKFSVEGVDSVIDKVSRVDIDAEIHPKLEPAIMQQSTVGAIECTCGMPLCICEAPTAKTDPVPMQTKPSSTFTSQLNPKPKKTDATPKNRGSTSSSKPSTLSHICGIGKQPELVLIGGQRGTMIKEKLMVLTSSISIISMVLK